MKRYISLLAVAAFGVTSCLEPSHLEDNLPASSVYLIDNGLQQTEIFYDVTGTYTQQVHAYCAGYYGGDPLVGIKSDEFALMDFNSANGTDYKMLPESCWSIEENSLRMQDRKAAFNLVFDCEELRKLSSSPLYTDLGSYVVPLTVSSKEPEVAVTSDHEELTSVFLMPRMSPMGFVFTQAGNKKLNYEEADVADGWIYLHYDVYTPVDNQWDNDVEFEFNYTTDGLNYKQLPAGCYVVNASSQGFSDGVSEIGYDVAIDESKADDVFYSIVARVKSKGTFVITGGDTSVIDFFNRISYPQAKMSIASCNSYQNDTYSPEKILDGNAGTFWHCAYNSSCIGEWGDVNFEIVVKLNEMKKLSAFGITRRSGTYATDLKAGYIEVSTDGSTFVRATGFDFGTAAENKLPGPMYFTSDPVDASYVKIVMTSCNRYASSVNKLANMAEFNVYYK